MKYCDMCPIPSICSERRKCRYVKETAKRPLDATACSRLPDLLPPAEILDAAEKVRVWMEMNGYRNWQIGGICDRRIASDRDEWRDAANGSLLGTVKNLDTALDALKIISVADWKTAGELRKMARDAHASANAKVDAPAHE